MYPDFIGIGAQKSGTTWLHRNLRAHPQVRMPQQKEVHYFDRKVNERANILTRLVGRREADLRWRRQVRNRAWINLVKEPSLRNLIRDFNYYVRPYTDEWYASIFEPAGGKVTGEITPAYSVLGREKVAHVHSIMPDTKIIFMMRNPIERVWSQAVMSFDTVEKGSAIFASEEELFKKVERNSSWSLTNYLQTLENWNSFYPEEQIFVSFLEDIHFYPEKLLTKLYDFLEVDPHFDPSLTGKKVHSRSTDRMPTSIAVHLAKRYREEIERLSERFGGYASWWLRCADQLIENPPETNEISYPLWESEMWGEWIVNGGDVEAPELQSGPLVSAKLEK